MFVVNVQLIYSTDENNNVKFTKHPQAFLVQPFCTGAGQAIIHAVVKQKSISKQRGEVHSFEDALYHTIKNDEMSRASLSAKYLDCL